jgi:hypothetical protein
MTSLRVALLAATAAVGVSAAAQAAPDHKACLELIDTATTDPLTHMIGTKLELYGVDLVVHALVQSDFDGFKHGKDAAFDWTPCVGDATAESTDLAPLDATGRGILVRVQELVDRTAKAKEAQTAAGYRFPTTGNAMTDEFAARYADSHADVPLPHYDVDAQCQRFTMTLQINACYAREQDAYNTIKAVWPELRWGREWIINHNGQGTYQAIQSVTFHMLDEQAALDRLTHHETFHY